jgi:hypothetical protein
MHHLAFGSDGNISLEDLRDTAGSLPDGRFQAVDRPVERLRRER